MFTKRSETSAVSRRLLHAGLAVAIGLVWGLTSAPASALDVPDIAQDAYDNALDAVKEAGNVAWTSPDAVKWSVEGTTPSPGGDYTTADDDILDDTDLVYDSFYGNGTPAGTASGNIVDVDDVVVGGNITGNVYGGLVSDAFGDSASDEDALGNVVRIKEGQEILGADFAGGGGLTAGNPNPSASIYGGYVAEGEGEASGNLVLIEKDTVIGSGYAPHIANPALPDDAYTGLVDEGGVYGGYVSDAALGGAGDTIGNANNNIIVIKGSNIYKNEIVGGSALNSVGGSGTANGNIVAVDLSAGGTFDFGGEQIVGGASTDGDADENVVYITGAYSSFDVNASATYSNNYSIYGGSTDSDAANNAVIINITGTGTGSLGFDEVYGAQVGDNATSNSVTIFNARINGDIYGAEAIAGNANSNEVYLVNTQARADIYGGYSGTLDANENKVTILSGTVAGDVWGGLADFANADDNTVTISGASLSGDVLGGQAGDGGNAGVSASGNTLEISNAKIDGAIVGGSVFGGDTLSGDQTRDNTVKISGRNTFDATNTIILGGDVESLRNTLETTNASNMTVNTVDNFEFYDFNLSADEINQDIYVINGAAVDLADTTNVNLTLDGKSTIFNVDDHVTLFTATDASGDLDSTKYTYKVNGALFSYDGYYYLGDGDTSLNFGISSRTQNDENRTYGQAQLAGLQMTNIASDFARDIAKLYGVASTAGECDPLRGGPVLFAGVNGGTSRWDTDGDTRTNLKHVSLLTGLGWRNENFLLAGYFEAGWGKYDAKLNGNKLVDGEKSDYIGGGILARFEAGSFYGEAGFHGGRLKTDFDGRFDPALTPNRVKYDTSVAYYGADAVLGYTLGMGCSTIDFSGRYSWNRVNSDDFRVDAFRIEQESVNSHRVRAGAEWSYNFGGIKPYVGAYYEHEFAAESKHNVQGISLLEASMKGSSGIGEIGVRFGGGESRFSADVGVEGYVGKRRGVTGKALVGFSF